MDQLAVPPSPFVWDVPLPETLSKDDPGLLLAHLLPGHAARDHTGIVEGERDEADHARDCSEELFHRFPSSFRCTTCTRSCDHGPCSANGRRSDSSCTAP